MQSAFRMNFEQFQKVLTPDDLYVFKTETNMFPGKYGNWSKNQNKLSFDHACGNFPKTVS